MGQVIYKYPLEIGETRVNIPLGAQILSVQTQRGQPVLWALGTPEFGLKERIFQTYGTGHPVPEDPGRYIGTYQLNEGGFIGHVFDETQGGL